MDAEWFLAGHSHEGYRLQPTEKQRILKDVRKLEVKIERKQYEVKKLLSELDDLRLRLAEIGRVERGAQSQ